MVGCSQRGETNERRPHTETTEERQRETDVILKTVQAFEGRIQNLEQQAQEKRYNTRPIWEKLVADIAQLQESLSKETREIKGSLRNLSRGQSVLNDAILKVHVDLVDIDERLQALEAHSQSAEFINLMRLEASPILRNVVTIQLAESNRLQPTVYEGRLNAEAFRFAIVASRWNELISARLVEGALDSLKRLGAKDANVSVYRVPGAFEIPLLALRLAQSRKFDAVICLGTIIRGQTPHFDYIASEVARGISHAGLTSGLPVVFGIVTADTVDQALDRAGVKLGNKGFEAAMTAVELVNLYKEAFE